MKKKRRLARRHRSRSRGKIYFKGKCAQYSWFLALFCEIGSNANIGGMVELLNLQQVFSVKLQKNTLQSKLNFRGLIKSVPMNHFIDFFLLRSVGITVKLHNWNTFSI